VACYSPSGAAKGAKYAPRFFPAFAGLNGRSHGGRTPGIFAHHLSPGVTQQDTFTTRGMFTTFQDPLLGMQSGGIR